MNTEEARARDEGGGCEGWEGRRGRVARVGGKERETREDKAKRGGGAKRGEWDYPLTLVFAECAVVGSMLKH